MPTLEQFDAYVKRLQEVGRNAGKESIQVDIFEISTHFGITLEEAQRTIIQWMLSQSLIQASVA